MSDRTVSEAVARRLGPDAIGRLRSLRRRLWWRRAVRAGVLVLAATVLCVALIQLLSRAFPFEFALYVQLGVVGVGALAWAVNYSSRRYRRSVPRYALAPLLVAQGGLAGRAAVLSAATTDPALVLLELRSALSEALAQWLGLSRLASPEQIVAELAKRPLFDAERVQQIGELFRALSAGQAPILARKRLKLSKEPLASLSRKVMEILDEIEERSSI